MLILIQFFNQQLRWAEFNPIYGEEWWMDVRITRRYSFCPMLHIRPTFSAQDPSYTALLKTTIPLRPFGLQGYSLVSHYRQTFHNKGRANYSFLLQMRWYVSLKPHTLRKSLLKILRKPLAIYTNLRDF